LKIIPSSLWTIFLVLIFAPEISSSELKGADDQAPQFLFVLHARHGKYMPQGGDLEVLQFPKKRISAVEMFSNRFQNVRSEFRQPQVRSLWKLRDVNFKKSAKATLSASQLRAQIVEINGIEVTPTHVRYWIVPVDRTTSIPGNLANVVLTMDAAATWKACSDTTKCLGFSSPLLNASVCYGEQIIRSNCDDCQCCPKGANP
jgi:hypothetical protein